MCELDLFDSSLDFEAFSEHTQRIVWHIVMAHVQDFQVTLWHQALLQWLNLRIWKFVSHQVQFSDGDDDQEIREDLSRNLVIINIKLGELAALDGFDERLGAIIVNAVILKLDLFKSWASVD